MLLKESLYISFAFKQISYGPNNQGEASKLNALFRLTYTSGVILKGRPGDAGTSCVLFRTGRWGLKS